MWLCEFEKKKTKSGNVWGWTLGKMNCGGRFSLQPHRPSQSWIVSPTHPWGIVTTSMLCAVAIWSSDWRRTAGIKNRNFSIRSCRWNKNGVLNSLVCLEVCTKNRHCSRMSRKFTTSLRSLNDFKTLASTESVSKTRRSPWKTNVAVWLWLFCVSRGKRQIPVTIKGTLVATTQSCSTRKVEKYLGMAQRTAKRLSLNGRGMVDTRRIRGGGLNAKCVLFDHWAIANDKDRVE